ncbi:unnamed protein product [Leptidea sinapis]|uniref:Uncharacterized protein n=1 Tax=Leptidea sinapis TaxID=189913 RepID=A0A5E4QFI1_9NEOP|nr:unnamed protein product [Leptidea sinapis]
MFKLLIIGNSSRSCQLSASTSRSKRSFGMTSALSFRYGILQDRSATVQLLLHTTVVQWVLYSCTILPMKRASTVYKTG